MNGIEGMTRHALIKGGIDANELPMLVYQAFNQHGPSGRLLERAIRTTLYMTRPSEDGMHPLEHPNEQYRQDGILYAIIKIGGFVWDDHTIRGTMPETLRLAIVGRPLRELVDGDFVPPDTIMHAGNPNELVTFDRIVVPMPRPTLWQRFAWLPRKWSLFVAEGMMDGPKPKWMIATMGALTLLTALVSIVVALDPGRREALSTIPVVMLTLAALNGVWFMANGVRRRQFSAFHAWAAAARHHSDMRS